MNNETKRLAIVATFCFFPFALFGLWFYKTSQQVALRLFRASIYLFLMIMSCAGIYVIIKGGTAIKMLMAFF